MSEEYVSSSSCFQTSQIDVGMKTYLVTLSVYILFHGVHIKTISITKSLSVFIYDFLFNSMLEIEHIFSNTYTMILHSLRKNRLSNFCWCFFTCCGCISVLLNLGCFMRNRISSFFSETLR